MNKIPTEITRKFSSDFNKTSLKLLVLRHSKTVKKRYIRIT